MGDTDFDENFMKPEQVDILFIPISGTYVMTMDEAIAAVKAINPKVAIPMHYDAGIVGSEKDALKFKSALGVKVQILKAEQVAN